MKTINRYLMCLCLMGMGLFATSCQSDDLPGDATENAEGYFELTVSPKSASTRASLGDDGITTQWLPGDELTLVSKSNLDNTITLTCTLTEASNSATFVCTQNVPNGKYWVVYGYNNHKDLKFSNVMNTTIETINDQDLMALYGEIEVKDNTKTANVTLKHIYALVQVTLPVRLPLRVTMQAACLARPVARCPTAMRVVM